MRVRILSRQKAWFLSCTLVQISWDAWSCVYYFLCLKHCPSLLHAFFAWLTPIYLQLSAKTWPLLKSAFSDPKRWAWYLAIPMLLSLFTTITTVYHWKTHLVCTLFPISSVLTPVHDASVWPGRSPWPPARSPMPSSSTRLVDHSKASHQTQNKAHIINHGWQAQHYLILSLTLFIPSASCQARKLLLTAWGSLLHTPTQLSTWALPHPRAASPALPTAWKRPQYVLTPFLALNQRASREFTQNSPQRDMFCLGGFKNISFLMYYIICKYFIY